MKKLFILGLLLLSVFYAKAQSFTSTGPKTIFDLSAQGTGGHYTFFNFETGKEVALADSNTANWHVAFRSTSIIFNGGTSGPSGITGQMLGGTTFNGLITAPASGYNSDGSTKIIPTGAGNGWYNYNYVPADNGPHSITAFADRVTVLKLANGKYVKLQILNYYQGAPLNIPTTGPVYSGVGKYYTFRYLVSGSDDLSNKVTRVLNLNTNITGNHYQFFNLASADTVTTLDSNSTKWDIAFRGTTILLNADMSGPDEDSAQVVLNNFNDVLTAPSTGWRSDNTSSKAIVTGSGNGWYNYDGATNIITPLSGRTILIKLSNGRYAKLIIESYYKDAPLAPTSSDVARYYTFSYEYVPDGSSSLTATIGAATTSFINPLSSEVLIKAYPVPVSGSELTIGWPSYLSVKSLKIINSRGLIVLEKNINNQEREVLFENLKLAKGLYLVSLEGEDVNETKKIMVE